MDANYVLLWIVGVSCVISSVQMARFSASAYRGWIIVNLAILVLIGIGQVGFPTYSGLVGGVVWTIFWLIPAYANRFMISLTLRQDYRRARHLASLLMWLHPFDGWLKQPRLFRAVEWAQQGQFEKAAEILRQYHGLKTPMARAAAVQLFRIESRWEDLLAWFRANCRESECLDDPILAPNYLRALGETGNLNEMVRCYPRCMRKYGESRQNVPLAMSRLGLFAFCGRPESVERLFRGPLAGCSESIHRYWRATARLAAGQTTEARSELEALLADPDLTIRKAVERRLNVPLPGADPVLTPEHRLIVEQAEKNLDQQDRYDVPMREAGRRAWGTILLIVLNAAVFATEWSLHAWQNIDTMFTLGALFAPSVWNGEWWRLVTSIFLHFGWLHVSMNLAGLWILGPFVERALGARRFLLVYFASGILAMLAVVLLEMRVPDHARLSAGASGCILGLVGATGAILLRGWRKERARVAYRRLLQIAALVGFQVAFDLATPQVSFSAHLSGLIIGFLATCLVQPKERSAIRESR